MAKARGIARIRAGFILIALVAAAVTMAARATRTHGLEAGDSLPPVTLRTSSGDTTLGGASDAAQIVMLFDSRCTHCHAQLDALAAHLADLGAARLTFVTGEAALNPRFGSQWPRLWHNAASTWATASPAELNKIFGPLVTPQTLIVDRQGHVRARFVGEVSPAALAHALPAT